jgi:hypothetical protein
MIRKSGHRFSERDHAQTYAGESGLRRSPSPATPRSHLLLQAQFGGFREAALDRATIEPDIAELAIVETAKQYEARLARALLDQGSDKMIDEAAGAGEEMPDCRSDRARSRSKASGMIQ